MVFEVRKVFHLPVRKRESKSVSCGILRAWHIQISSFLRKIKRVKERGREREERGKELVSRRVRARSAKKFKK